MHAAGLHYGARSLLAAATIGGCATVNAPFEMSGAELEYAVSLGYIQKTGCDPVHWGCPDVILAATEVVCLPLKGGLVATCDVKVDGKAEVCRYELKRNHEQSPWVAAADNCES